MQGTKDRSDKKACGEGITGYSHLSLFFLKSRSRTTDFRQDSRRRITGATKQGRVVGLWCTWRSSGTLWVLWILSHACGGQARRGGLMNGGPIGRGATRSCADRCGHIKSGPPIAPQHLPAPASNHPLIRRQRGAAASPPARPRLASRAGRSRTRQSRPPRPQTWLAPCRRACSCRRACRLRPGSP